MSKKKDKKSPVTKEVIDELSEVLSASSVEPEEAQVAAVAEDESPAEEQKEPVAEVKVAPPKAERKIKVELSQDPAESYELTWQGLSASENGLDTYLRQKVVLYYNQRNERIRPDQVTQKHLDRACRDYVFMRQVEPEIRLNFLGK